MTMAGMRKTSIFLSTRFSTLGSIDLASSPTRSIVGVVMLAISFDAPAWATAALLSRTDDAVMLKILSSASVDWPVASTRFSMTYTGIEQRWPKDNFEVPQL